MNEEGVSVVKSGRKNIYTFFAVFTVVLHAKAAVTAKVTDVAENIIINCVLCYVVRILYYTGYLKWPKRRQW